FDGITSAASDGDINWQVGDQIVIASSSYNYAEEEVRTIVSVTKSRLRTWLKLDEPLEHRHYGRVQWS
ncbi:MAG: hypothetical protein AAF438_15855, partial [Pseudomonadota bacterium]